VNPGTQITTACEAGKRAGHPYFACFIRRIKRIAGMTPDECRRIVRQVRAAAHIFCATSQDNKGQDKGCIIVERFSPLT